MLERLFKLSENKTTVRKEMIAGLVTFLTMSYILAVNPAILHDAGMDKHAVFTATVISIIIGTLSMALLANLPIALAPGMGLNTFFAYTVVIHMGCSWQFALTAVFIEGLIFMMLTFFNVRELIIKSVPSVLRDAIPVGIGLFITLIGLEKAKIVTLDPHTLVSLGDLSNHSVWIAFLGLFVTVVLLARNINGAILIGIVVSTIFAVILRDVSPPQDGQFFSMPPSIAPIFCKFEWSEVLTFKMLIVVFTFLFVNLFDTVGTLIGVVSKAGLMDKNGNIPRVKRALLADAIGTLSGSMLGTSPVTAYVESASGVSAGGRTGLTAVSVAILFILSLFLAPLFGLIPASATAPALIIVGLFMISAVIKIDFNDITESFPAFVTMIFMPFTYSIAQGIVFGMLSFVVIKLFSGKHRQISVTVYIISVLFVIKLVMDAINLFHK